jgi:hypothetical protein
MSFRATDFEFRHRSLVITGIFFAFGLYALDHTNISQTAAQALVSRQPGANSVQLLGCVRAILAVGTLVVAPAAFIRSWAGAYIHSAVVHDVALHTDRLVADGPYRHVRNPLYLGSMLLAVGLGTMASRIGFFFLLAGIISFLYRLILREEAGLLQSQGESYRKYYDAVPRLLPSLLPRVPAGGRKPNWLDGFLGETFFWSFPVGMAAFAATLRIEYFWVIMGAGFAIRFVQAFLRRRMRAATP